MLVTGVCLLENAARFRLKGLCTRNFDPDDEDADYDLDYRVDGVVNGLPHFK